LTTRRAQSLCARTTGTYIEIARARNVGIILDTPTWRANPDWGERVGYTSEALTDVDRRGVALLEELRSPEVLISGCIGPRGDAYKVDGEMSAAEAQSYHGPQVRTFGETSADLVSALTLTYANEAIGIVRAARAVDVPVVISFTVETDGQLPSGQALGEAIQQVDAETDEAAAYFMINCAHPTHFSVSWSPLPGSSDSEACERMPEEEPRGAGRVGGAGRRRPCRAGHRLPRAAQPAAEPDRGRRLLRHRPSPRRRSLRSSDGLGVVPRHVVDGPLSR
jgi:hypothetical protein